MKLVIKLVVFSFIMLSFSSCYNTKIAVGDTSVNGPTYKVNSEWNHHLLWGLVPLNNAKMRGGEYVDNRPDYVVKTNLSFLNGLVGFLTLGIYTPSTTTYYLPIPEEGLYTTTPNTSKSEKKQFYTKTPKESRTIIPERIIPKEEMIDTPEEVVTFIIYFNNGSNIKGEIVERQEDITTIRTLSGRIARYRNSDISRIVKEND